MVSKPRKKNENHNLLSKADIAEMLNISSQLLSNKASRAAERGESFPEPTYSNGSGTVALYTLDDAKQVYEYVTKEERERLEKAKAAFEKFGLVTSDGEPVEEPTLDLGKPAEKAEAKAEPKAAEPKVVPAKATEKPADKPAQGKPATVTDAKAPEVKADAAKTAPKAAPVADKAAPAANKTATSGNASTPAKVSTPGSSFGVTAK